MGWLFALALSATTGHAAAQSSDAGDVPSDAAAFEIPLAIEGHFSVLSNQSNRSLLAVTFGGGVRVGWRRADGLGVFVLLEQNAWLGTELFRSVVPGVFDAAVGVEKVWADGLIRTSGAFGMSILTGDTELHRAGSVGLYLDARPASLRWRPRPHVAVELSPLHLTLVAPALGRTPLRQIEYRTSIAVEVGLRR